jgi:cytochrome P450
VEEFLCFEVPVQLNLRRYANAQTEVGGVAVATGEWLVPAVDAPNHYGRAFDAPDSFDITRRAGQHLTFGRGIHFCIGASLARLQVWTAVETVLRRYPDLERRGELALRGTPLLRTLESLPVGLAWTPSVVGGADVLSSSEVFAERRRFGPQRVQQLAIGRGERLESLLD